MDCFHKMITLSWVRKAQTSNLKVPGRISQHVISAMKAERLIKFGCEGYSTFIMEDKQPQVVEDIPVVRKFPNIFPEEILKLPFVRERDFTIDLILGTAPIS
eukprot:TRINITY_DN13923_c3_g1_i1.p1 TRINITY_DN13923_c3_g1~~TRINITY_DN13923_c3_g1_i1.p1  ORF type:complete len:102 (-),score=4.20 TRINITY_DN13923_c3_g1_i1:553-858(-)